MAIESVSGRSRSLGIAAVILGLLGLALFWWVPMAMVLSLTGLMLAIIGWVNQARLSGNARPVLAGLILCAAALALDLFIAVRGWEMIHLVSYH
jgi:hypothetical protein